MGPVCSTTWTEENARVACRQMGFSNGSVPAQSNITSSSTFHQQSFACSGEERSLLSCPLVETNCTGQQAQVSCSGPTSVRLVGGENAASGNVYFNNGPVCDDHWDIEDGNVVCN